MELRPGEAQTRGMVRRSLMASLLALGIAGTFLPLGSAALVARGPALSFAAAQHYTLRRTPSALASGDVDGDKPDVVTAGCDSNSVSVLLNRGDGALERERDYEAGRNPE